MQYYTYEEASMYKILRNSKFIISLFLTAFIMHFFSFAFVLPVKAANQARIHYLTLPGSTIAVLLECNGRFGMVDSGEDTDYPDGSDPRYPMRPGITQGIGYEDDVIAYLNSAGVTQENFEFYIGTHPHSDHIGSADEIIRAFHPKRVYIQEYKDSYVTYTGNLWDNLYVYDHMLEAATEVGATIIQNFSPHVPLYPEKVSIRGSVFWDDENDQEGLRPDEIAISLLDSASNEIQHLHISADESGNWSYQFSHLQKYDDTKTPIVYRVQLNDLDSNYEISNPDNEYDFVCSHIPEEVPPEEVDKPDEYSHSKSSEAEENGEENISENQEKTDEDQFNIMDNSETTNEIDTSDVIDGLDTIEKIDDTSVMEEPEAADEPADTSVVEDPEAADEPADASVVEDLEATDELDDISVMEGPETADKFNVSDAMEIVDGTVPTASPELTDTAENVKNSNVSKGGIFDDDTSNQPVKETSDDLFTSEITFYDQVDATCLLDPNNAASLLDAAPAQTGIFDDLSEEQNTTSTPTFTLGDDMLIQIKHYGTDYKTNPKPDANYFSLGVLIECNGKSAFLSGDINNYEGAETALIEELGHIDILTLGHHGHYGSNTYGYITGLSPKIMVCPGKCADIPNYNDEYSTLKALLLMNEKGTPLYSTDWYHESCDALVFSFDESLSNNIPSPVSQLLVSNAPDSIDHLYYLDGIPYAYNGWIDFNGQTYYFDNNFFSEKNKWVLIGTKRYYLNPDGTRKTEEWLSLDNKWYYLDSTGVMSTGWLFLNNKTYYFDSDSGNMLTGWQLIDDNRYYLAPTNGSLQSGWQFINDVWYYLEPDTSIMLTGWQFIHSKWYYLTPSNGAMKTGWQFINHKWYYLTPDSGDMKTGWQKINGKYYYMYSSGEMAANTYINEYYVNKSGIWVP